MTKEEALKKLIRFGLFLPMEDITLYHGRAAVDGEKWEVNPNLDNSWNNTGNKNINRIPALNTTRDFDIAREFAVKRTRQSFFETGEELAPEVHKIEAIHDDALILNTAFRAEHLSKEDQNVYYEALASIAKFWPLEYDPVDFGDRNNADKVLKVLESERTSDSRGCPLYDKTIIERAKNRLKSLGLTDIDGLIEHIARAYNTKGLIRGLPIEVVDSLRKNCDYLEVNWRDGKVYSFPISANVITTFMSRNNIVGEKLSVLSATVKKSLDNYILFDLHEINTREKVRERRKRIVALNTPMDNLITKSGTKSSNSSMSIFDIEEEKELMDKLCENETINKFFRADSGVWERLTVGEHTETTLRILRDSYSHDLSPNINRIMKLALVIHDIEKGIYRSNRSRKAEEVRKEALDEFYQVIHVDDLTKTIAEFIAKRSQYFTSKYFVNHDFTALEGLTSETRTLLTQCTGMSEDKISNDLVRSLMRLCIILQTCDSGAYTFYATNRDEKRAGVFFRGGNEWFTNSFEIPLGLAHNCLRLKNPNGTTKDTNAGV